MATNTRERFDPERDFTVFKPMMVNGNILVRGSTFDKTLVATRRLRQLYDQHYVVFAEQSKTQVQEQVASIPPKKIERVKRERVARVSRNSQVA